MSDAFPLGCVALIDDHADLRCAIVRELCHEFPNAEFLEIIGPDSLEHALSRELNVAIIDSTLSWGDGLTVLRRLKQAHPNCPVIMFCDNTSQALVVEAMKAKLDDFLLKAPLREQLNALRRAVCAAVECAARKAQDEAIGRRVGDEILNDRNTFQALLESQPGVVYMFERYGRFLRWNKQFEEVTGYTSVEISRMHPAEMIPVDQREFTVARIREAYARGAAQADVDLLTKDGRRIPYSFTARRMDLGNRPCMIGVGIDISDRKKMENELRRNAEALRHADQRKNEFLAMLAHELRNPLGPIRNAMQILRKTRPLDIEAESLRCIVDRQVSHMARLIDDLLDVSRVSRGRILLRMERMDLSKVARTAINDHRSAFEAIDIRLECTIPDTPIWIMGDVTRVAQIIGNILNNALKFTDMGGWVKTSQRISNGFVALVFADSGIGISPEMLPQLFSPFVQADESIDRTRGGLGLGLALVKGLVELHGGHASAFSEGLGKGTRITIDFPLTASPPQVAQAAISTQAAPRSACRILIIEDNIDAADTTKTLLEIAGHTVEVVNTGTAAIHAGHRFEPEIVICDIGLPDGMDGYAVARAMRADDRLASCYLIALSGYGQAEDQRRAQQAGFDIHLTKPLDPTILEEVIQNVMGNRTSTTR
jgi:PAS domain S-box-containing protein